MFQAFLTSLNFNTHFSALSDLFLIGLALLAECGPIAFEAREANNLPRALSSNERGVSTSDTGVVLPLQLWSTLLSTQEPTCFSLRQYFDLKLLR